MGLSQTVPPVVFPLSVNDMKAHSRIWLTTEDAVLQSYIQAATLAIQNEVRRSLVPQKWQLALDGFPSWDERHRDRSHLFTDRFQPIALPMPPVVSVDSFTYVDTNGVTQTLVLNTDFVFSNSGLPNKVLPGYNLNWPASARFYPDTVLINYSAGYPLTQLPDPLLSAIKLLAAGLYENRESAAQATQLQELPNGLAVIRLIGPYMQLKF